MTLKRWRYIDDPLDDGALNMATDLALLTACNEEAAPPTLRLYGWLQPTLSVSYSQRGWNSIDIHYCQEQQVPIVRRPTGGRILLHHEELTYSIVAPLDHPSFPKGFRKTHLTISESLAGCLNELKLPSPARVDSELISKEPDGLKTIACFALSNAFEVTVGGKKVIASAQRRLRKAFLQHGSILLRFDPERINSLLRFPNSETQVRHLNQLKDTASDLKILCREPLDFVKLKGIFLQKLSQTLVKEAIPGQLSEYEKNLRDRFSEISLKFDK